MMIAAPHVNIANKYCRDVVSGKISACQLTQLACQRHLNDLQRKDWVYHFDRSLAERPCVYAENLVHTKGIFAGQHFRPDPWECFVLCSIFGWVDHRKRRRFLEVYLEIPRKNGKSYLDAVIALYLLTADEEEEPEIYAGAASRKQAKNVFIPITRMIAKLPALEKFYKLEVFKESIYSHKNAGRIECLIGNPPEGQNPSVAIIDEYHEHKTSVAYDCMDTGTVSRAEPLLMVTTTAGNNLKYPCYEHHHKIITLLKGTYIDERLFGLIYSIDDDDDWRDYSVWKKANPGFGVSLNEDIIKRKYLTALQDESKRNNILTKHLNVWCSVDKAWLDILKLRKCVDKTITPDQLKDKRCVICLDLASKLDLAAKVILFFDDTHYWAFGTYYLPRDTVENGTVKNRSAYEAWEAQGLLTVTEGPTIDFERIEDDLLEDCKKYNPEVVGYDPFQATEFAQRMKKAGVDNMVEIGATVGNFSEPMKEFQRAIYAQQFTYTGSLLYEWQCSNVVAHYDKKDNIFPNKASPGQKIDGVVATIMCFNVAIRLKNKDNEPKTGLSFM